MSAPSGTADNGLGFSQTVSGGGTSATGTCTGTKYVVHSGGNSVTITCNPSVHVTGYMAGIAANVSYVAQMLVPEISLTGGIGTSATKRYLIGQHGFSELSVTDLSPTTFNWSISGCFPFKNYVANDNSGVYTSMGSETGNFMGFYFAKPGTATITCTAHLTPGAGAKPEAGMDVTLHQTCGVDAPAYTLLTTIGWPRFTPAAPAAPTMFQLLGAQPPDPNVQVPDAGTLWVASVTTPANYVATYGNGLCGYAQLITPHIAYTDNGQRYIMTSAWEGVERLDGGFLCLGHSFSGDGSKDVFGDSPGSSITATMSAVEMAMSFKTYLMYKPGGSDSCFVPLRDFSWSWDVYANKGGNGTWSFTIGSVFPMIYPGVDFPSHPMWNMAWANNPVFTPF